MNHMANRVPLEQLARFNPAEKNKVRFAYLFDTAIYAAAGHDSLSLCVTPEGGQIEHAPVFGQQQRQFRQITGAEGAAGQAVAVQFAVTDAPAAPVEVRVPDEAEVDHL